MRMRPYRDTIEKQKEKYLPRNADITEVFKFLKITAVVIAAMMMVAMSAVVFAAGEYTVNINPDSSDKATHEYEAYQIFAGDLNADQTKLSNIKWGTGIDQTKLGALANAIESLRTSKDAEDDKALTASSTATEFANAMGELTTTQGDSANEQALADAIAAALSNQTFGTNGAKAVTGLDAGYYFIQDARNPIGTEGALTRYILQVVKTVTVTEKASVPTVTKKVQDKDDTAGTTSGWQDSADYDIGDAVPYQITATLPSTFADFDKYTVYTITDTLEAGLTPPAASGVTITVNPSVSTAVADIFDVDVTDQVIEISLKNSVDLKTISGITKDTKFVVTYDAVLNQNAEIGKKGNANEVDLEYSNNPNWDGIGTPTTGKTPKDKVIVFTYQPEITKFNDKNEALAGAGFTLYKEVKDAIAGTTQTGAEIKASLKQQNASINASQLVDERNYIVKAMTLVTDKTNEFYFKGIDDGTYVLVETTIPDGYNAFVSEKVVVTATHDEESADPELMELTADKVISTTSVDDGTLKGNVINNSGATLPSTGGIGTTMFYIIGAILVLGAAVLLVTKKRVSAE